MSDPLPTIGSARRRRLPQRRPAVTETIQFMRGDGNLVSYEASVGFDELGRPKEIFLFGAKQGTDMAAVLADTAVALSVALQHGISAEALALSVGRFAPAGEPFEHFTEKPGMPISVIGAALDLLVRYERPEWQKEAAE